MTSPSFHREWLRLEHIICPGSPQKSLTKCSLVTWVSSFRRQELLLWSHFVEHLMCILIPVPMCLICSTAVSIYIIHMLLLKDCNSSFFNWVSFFFFTSAKLMGSRQFIYVKKEYVRVLDNLSKDRIFWFETIICIVRCEIWKTWSSWTST